MATFTGRHAWGEKQRSTHDWYCRFCDDFWGGHYVNRGHRHECYKCKLAKGECFDGKPPPSGNPSQRVATRVKPVTAIKKEYARKRDDSQEGDWIAKLASEIRVLKTTDGADELLQLKQHQYEKLVSERQAAKPIGA